jgi:toxin ParE1/3/4
MAFRVRLTPRAAEDIERIYRLVVQEAPLHGQEWYNRLIRVIDSLTSQPNRCRAVETLSTRRSTVRKLLYGRKPHVYSIYFDVVEDSVRILPFRHGARREPTRRELFR